MSVFFDTNILVYAQESSQKGDTARALLAGGGILSVQVLNEFASVSARRQGRSWPEIDEAITDILAVVSAPVPITLAIHEEARRLASTQNFAFYDALIVAAAIETGCDMLHSEDLQHGRSIGGLVILNPFLASAA